MCVDGLKQEQILVGSSYVDYISGTNVVVGTETTTTSTDTTANVTTLNATNIKAGSSALSSGSVWVTFSNVFSNALYHVAASPRDRTVGDQQMIGVGSQAPGSFIAMGSLATSTAVFDWVAIPRGS